MTTPAIVTHQLTKHFGATEALHELDLEVAPGEVFGFLGSNGAGKTTTIRLLLGLLTPTAGRAEVFGLDCQHRAPEAHRRIGYVPGDVGLWPNLTGGQTLELLGRLQPRRDPSLRHQLLERFQLDPTKKVRTYSKGNRQKVALIAALMGRPELLILDEPTGGLDPVMEQEFRRYVREAAAAGQTVFLSSHLLGEVDAVCDRIGILRHGRLVEVGRLDELRHLSALSIEAVFDGPPPDVARVPGVSAANVDGNRLRCHVEGEVGPLLRALIDAGVTRLTSREPSVEEMFLARYGDADRAPVDGPGSVTGA